MAGFLGQCVAVARLLGQGLMRSVLVVVLAGAVPALWVAAGIFFFTVIDDAVGAAWCVFGVVVVSLAVATRPICRAMRTLVTRWTGVEVPGGLPDSVAVTRMATGYWWNGYDYQRLRSVSVIQRWLQTRLREPAFWREASWLVVSPLTVGALAAIPLACIGAAIITLATPGATPLRSAAPARGLAAAAIVLGALLLPLCWRPTAPLARRLLGPSPSSRLTARVAALVQGRADLTQAQDAELRRIERNLHDGAQARLVAIGLSLGAAERLVDTDPEAAKQVLKQARESSLVAVRELRELVHGIVPPVLLERGLVDALRQLALDAPIRTTVTSTFEGRAETPIESALYFTTAELVTNAVKHARATSIEITVGRRGANLYVDVRDDGRGGARVTPLGGLDGVIARVRAFDGTVRVDSPTGGPTLIAVDVPCA
ncbi:sensor histidine kinase [Gryllotalpicola reticulitermitis]|uniref:histidine kinase n=1 Tax=Gryllotalpicola reticulitermitis TaxID=1184153 RepID=A0ABV8Q5V7_9MICO